MEWHRIRNLPRTQAINSLGGESAPLILVKKEQFGDLILALSFRGAVNNLKISLVQRYAKADSDVSYALSVNHVQEIL